MRLRSLTELAATPGLISGIYNYCDRWCERCPFTSRCLVYVREQEYEFPDESHDLTNAAFWERLKDSLDEANQMITEWAKKQGLSISELQAEEPSEGPWKRQNIENHALARAGKHYANNAVDWFRNFDQNFGGVVRDLDSEQIDQMRDAREIIEWYQYQIAVKTIRALSSRRDESTEILFDGEELFQKDSDGSAKVALIGIDRSIAAWRLMQLALTNGAETTVPLLMELEKLRRRIEKSFPEARSFIRPGFDEVIGESN
jgi:hypothetical protein